MPQRFAPGADDIGRFIDGGYFEHHLNKMRRIYRERRDALISAIDQWQFRSKIAIKGIETGLHLVVVFPPEVAEESLVSAAAKVGIRVHAFRIPPGSNIIETIAHPDSGVRPSDSGGACRGRRTFASGLGWPGPLNRAMMETKRTN
jgi:hypothetical protein